MKKMILLLAYCLSSTAYAGEHNKFGIDLLRSSSDIACDNVKEIVINPLWDTSCDDTSSGYRISYAIQIKPTYYVELAYADLGEVEWKGHFTGFDNGGPNTFIDQETVKFGASTFEVLAIKEIALSQSFSIQLLAGAAFSKGTYKSSEYREDTDVPNSGWTEKVSQSENNLAPVVGLGLTYKRLMVSYKLHKDIDTGEAGETDISSFGVGVRF